MRRSLRALVIGCILLGGSTAALPAHAADLTPAAYKIKVNATCTVGLTKMKAVAKPATAAAVGPFLQKQGELGATLIRQISAVKPPIALQSGVRKALKLQGAQVDFILGLADKIKKGADPEATITAADTTMTTMSTQSDVAWKAVGLSACIG